MTANVNFCKRFNECSLFWSFLGGICIFLNKDEKILILDEKSFFNILYLVTLYIIQYLILLLKNLNTQRDLICECSHSGSNYQMKLHWVMYVGCLQARGLWFNYYIHLYFKNSKLIRVHLITFKFIYICDFYVTYN